MEKTIRLLIVDDHTVVRHGLKLMLDLKAGIEVVGEARDGEAAIDLAGKLNPDVILMDLEMPGMGGLEAIARIHSRDAQVRILVLTSFTDSQKIAAAIKNGAAGYILKDSSPGALVQAIRDVDRGKVSMQLDIAQKMVEGLQALSEASTAGAGLTQREKEILQLAAGGMLNHEIAARLVVSEGTVRFHFSNIYNKLQVHNRSQAIIKAIQLDLVDLGDPP